jgi:hypothetical protein
MRPHYVAPVALALALACWTSSAHADNVAAASKAFAEGQKASLAEDHARAAEFYELADSLAPSAPALRLATRSHYSAGHVATAATLAAELLSRYPSDKEARDTAEKILAELTPTLAHIDAKCGGGCSVTIDGRALSEENHEKYSFFVQPGEHEVIGVFAEGETVKKIDVAAGRAITIELVAPPKPEPIVEPVKEPDPDPPVVIEVPKPLPPVKHGGKGIRRLWVIGGSVLTIGLGAAATFSGLATLDTRDKVVEAVDANDNATATELYNKGRDEQIRTNILFGATAAIGITTVVLAFFTNWSGDGDDVERESSLSFAPSRDGGAIVYGAHF